MESPNDISPTFCALPWIHLASKPDGRVQMCCMASGDLTDKSGKGHRLDRDAVSDIFNAPEIVDARQKMLKGEAVKACAGCYREEKLGGHSVRIGLSQKWLLREGEEIRRRMEESEKNGGRLASLPFYLDLRQGNLCNLKCRSCSPDNSKSLELEYAKLVDGNPWFKENVWGRTLDGEAFSWYESAVFEAEFQKLLPQIKMLYFTGGEPTLIERNYELLEQMIEEGHASRIELMFNTNVTKITDRFIQILGSFQHVLLNLSLDGFGSTQEYLRYPSKWEHIAGNLRKLGAADLPNVHLCVNPVLQAYNILTISELWKFVEDLNREMGGHRFFVMPIFLDSPAHLDVRILPASVRQIAYDRFVRFMETSEFLERDGFFKTRLQQALALLKDESLSGREDLRSKFYQYTAVLDASRKQSYRESLPELASHFPLGGTV